MSEKELKEQIVELTVENAGLRVPKGNCPGAYYNLPESPYCEDGKCMECRRWFLGEIRKQVEKELGLAA